MSTDPVAELEEIYGTNREPPFGELWAVWHVMCALCGAQDEAHANRDVRAKQAFRADGWKLSRADGWLCPACK